MVPEPDGGGGSSATTTVQDSLGGQLDELPEQLGPWARQGAEAQLCGHPVLQLVEAAHEALQVGGGDITQVLGTQHVVDQLHLAGEVR